MLARVKPVVFSYRDAKVSPNWRTVGKLGQGRKKRRWSLDDELQGVPVLGRISWGLGSSRVSFTSFLGKLLDLGGSGGVVGCRLQAGMGRCDC